MELYRRLRIDESGIGQKFGRLTVIGPWFSVRNDRGNANQYGVCQCECGRRVAIKKTALVNQDNRSCGCLQRESQTRNGSRTRHGHARKGTQTKEYRTWIGVVRRCEDIRHDAYESYGARGIKVCARWRNSFEAFFEDMGPKPSPAHSIERINNDGDYEPENCRWATGKDQARNRRTNRILTLNGESNPIAVWSEKTGIPANVLWTRIYYGWSVQRALTGEYRPRRRRA